MTQITRHALSFVIHAILSLALLVFITYGVEASEGCNMPNPTTLEVAEYIQDYQSLYEGKQKVYHPLQKRWITYNVDGRTGICAAYYVANEIIARVRSRGYDKERLWKVYLAILQTESGFDMYAKNFNTLTNDNCMAQVNSIHIGPGQEASSYEELYTFDGCINASLDIWFSNLHGASNAHIKNSLEDYNGSRGYARLVWRRYLSIERQLPDWQPVDEYMTDSSYCSKQTPTELEQYTNPLGYYKKGEFYCEVIF